MPSTCLPERLEEEWRISESQATLTPPPNPLCSTQALHRCVLPSYSDSQGRQRSECPELRGEAPAQVAFDVPATVPEWEEGGKIQ